ncbi:MAG: hypothetical protein V9G04_03215 [Nocardioides sp.]|jgi:hypothetical protein
MNTAMNDETTELAFDEPVASESGIHPINVAHLVMGLAFLGFVAIWGVWEASNYDVTDARWLLPLPWLFAGGAGVLALLLAGRRRTN